MNVQIKYRIYTSYNFRRLDNLGIKIKFRKNKLFWKTIIDNDIDDIGIYIEEIYYEWCTERIEHFERQLEKHYEGSIEMYITSAVKKYFRLKQCKTYSQDEYKRSVSKHTTNGWNSMIVEIPDDIED